MPKASASNSHREYELILINNANLVNHSCSERGECLLGWPARLTPVQNYTIQMLE